MEFPWISNVPGTHKQHSFLHKSNAHHSPSFLLSSSSQSSASSSSQALPSAAPPGFMRRPRADTMPAPSTPFVFSRDYASSLDVPSQPTMRHRSGSATETGKRNGMGFSTILFSSATLGSAASSPIDETDVASTLASLGLIEDNEHNRLPSSKNVPILSVTTEPTLRGNNSSSNNNNNDSNGGDGGSTLPTPTRGRAYTVGTRTPLERPNVNRLFNFDPFSLDNDSPGQQQRPRAISLGMADEPVPPSRLLFSATHNAAQRLQQQQQQHQRQDSPLRTSASSGNLVDYMNYSELPERDISTQSSPSTSAAQVPSRALWLGNIDASLNVPELMRLFSCYGHVESARILSDKECAFVNFASVESAVAAKNDLETRLGNKVKGTTVRVGYGKADVNQAMANTSEAGPNAQGPTRALWIGNIPANMNPGILRAIFQPFGPIESVRVLSHKSCGFVNFEQQQDAVHARKALQNKEILGPGTGAVRIGFAKAPTASADESRPGEDKASHFPTAAVQANSDTYQATQWAAAMMMSSMMRTVAGDHQPSSGPSQPTSLYAAIAAERTFIMRQLGHEDTSTAVEERLPMAYCSAIPLVPELGSDRKLEVLRLREMRKKLDNGQQSLQDIEAMAAECMEEAVELCNDYIGNTVIQKLFEACSEATRLAMLERIAPFLASIGVHKNGTWAAQKIIDSAESPVLIRTISVHIAPYIPLLLLDQFGNYVVQCCLRKGPEYNQYILDAIADKCWEIGQGRFGARAVRAILESASVTREQQTYVAAAIIQNTVLLTTNANGVLLLIWLLDTSKLSGRYSALCPRLLPYLGKLCTHKLGSMTVFKIISQTEEPDARRLLLNAIFNEPSLLDDVLRDQIHGLGLVQKILSIEDLERRDIIAQQIRDSINRLQLQHVQAYKKLLEELEQSVDNNNNNNNEDCQENSTQDSSAKGPTDDGNDNSKPASGEDTQWTRNPQAVAMMANMYAAAMATAAASMQQQQQQPVTNGSPNMPDFSQFDHFIKSLLRNNNNVQTSTVKDTN